MHSSSTPVITLFATLCVLGCVLGLEVRAVEKLSGRPTGKTLGSGTEPLKIDLKHPESGWTVDRMLKVSGTVSDRSVSPIVVAINGDKYLIRTQDGTFSRKFPITSGKNSILVQGSNRAGTGKVERTVFGAVPPIGILLVLTSDTDGVYTDLHLYEPALQGAAPGRESKSKESPLNLEQQFAHVYWAQTHSPSGGKFYLNEQGESFDQAGYGPYLYTHSSPPLGIYRVDANYWPSGDKAHTVASLNIVLFGGTVREQRRTIKQPLVTPGETTTLAWLKIEKGQESSIYIPLLDRRPKEDKVWPKWVLDYVPRRVGTPED